MPSRSSVIRTSVELRARAPRGRPCSRSWVSGRGRHDALLGERDRGGLDRADPDRQVAVAVHLAQQHDRLVGGHLDPDTHDVELAHTVTLPRARGSARRASPPGRARVRTPGRRGRSPALTRAACSRTDSAASSRAVSSARARGLGPRWRAQRRDHLLDQADLAVGGGLERPQVTRLEPEPRELGEPRVAIASASLVVVAVRPRARPARTAPARPAARSVDPGGLEQLVARQPQRRRRRGRTPPRSARRRRAAGRRRRAGAAGSVRGGSARGRSRRGGP